MRFLTFLIAIFVAASVEAAAITITKTGFAADADDSIGSEVYKVFEGTAIPTSTTFDAIDGIAYSKNLINWSDNGSQTILSFDMEHKRVGTGISASGVGPLEFTANSNEPYEFSGFYNVTDVGASGRVFLTFSFFDKTGSSTGLVTNIQDSGRTTNEQFVLGGKGGDSLNRMDGSMTGNLIAGHSYQLNFILQIMAYPDIDSGASALGNITMRIGVPEPSTLLLLGIGAISLLGYRKAKSHG